MLNALAFGEAVIENSCSQETFHFRWQHLGQETFPSESEVEFGPTPLYATARPLLDNVAPLEKSALFDT